MKIGANVYECSSKHFLCFNSMTSSILLDMIRVNRLRAKKGPAPPPREFCRHILS